MRLSSSSTWLPILASACLAGCGGDPPATANEPPLFTEITAASGLDDSPARPPEGTWALPEIMGGGVAVFDADADGDLDILHVETPIPGRNPAAEAPVRLYLRGPDGAWRDATAGSGLGRGYGQGVTTGDVEGDGDVDVYVTNLGPDALYRNRGDGTFEDATGESGIAGDHWSTSAAFVDHDGDGDLDLFVVHYGVYDPGRRCTGADGAPDYCNPLAYEGTVDALYENDGSGTLTDVTARAGIDARGRGLGIVAADLTGDGLVDLYVANDGEANHLWVQREDGTFADEAVMRGAAFNAYGEPEGSMGVDAGDVDGDGRLDLFTTHLVGETNTLYLGAEGGVFADRTDAAGMGRIDRPNTGFGTGFLDFDHDGDLDLAVVNGGVGRGRVHPGAALGPFWDPIAEPDLLFENVGGGRFADVGGRAGAFGERVEVGRGLAYGDLDEDGDLDLVVGSLGGVRIHRNDAPAPGTHWLIVRAVTGRRDALGAEVTVTAGGRRVTRLARAGYSYASAGDPRAHFGLGGADAIEALEVRWPDGAREAFDPPGVDRAVTVRNGEGRPIE